MMQEYIREYINETVYVLASVETEIKTVKE